jgi:hypothetical protein
MARFAPPDGLLTTEVEASVRLAWSEDGLLVLAQGLPPNGVIELSMGEPGGEAAVWSIEADEGLSSHPLEIAAGELRPMWLHIRTPDAEGALIRPWSPTGSGQLSSFPALIADAPSLGFDPKITEGLVVAPGADRLSLTLMTNEIPRRSRGVPDPWGTTSRGALSLAVPHTGWYRLEAHWKDEGEQIDVAAWRVYLKARPAYLSVNGIFPTPSWHASLGGKPLVLSERTAVCLTEPDWQPVADLLISEVERLSGHVLTQKERCRDGDITISKADADNVPIDALAYATIPDAFTLNINEGATVSGWNLRGTVYATLALVDAIGVNGEAEPLTVIDAPDVSERILYHQINLSNRGSLALDVWLEEWLDFLKQVVLRGRYNQIFLNLLDNYQLENHPELSGPNSLDPDQLGKMLSVAEGLGIEVFPAISAPSHATWITKAYPELASGGQVGLLCPRHPAVRPLLSEVYSELLLLFNSPRKVHIGHDEVFWDPARTFEDERDPRCAGTPSWVLLEEDLRWHVDFFEQQGVAPIAWSDMLVEGWNGGREGAWRAAQSEDLQESLTVAAWSKVGDSQGVLSDQGYPVIRLHTGYHDWKRTGLRPSEVAGEGLALFHPFPWMAAGVNAGTQPLRFYWSQVLLAGATAWRPSLTAVPIKESLRAISELPSMRPGWQHSGPWNGTASPVLMAGEPPPAYLPTVRWPDYVDVGEIRFLALSPVAVTEKEAALLTVDRPVVALSILQAVVLDRDVRQLLVGQSRSPQALAEVAALTVTWEDGEVERIPIHLGMQTFDLTADPRAIALWGTPGVTLPSEEAIQSARGGHDRQLYRLDWRNKRPDVPVRSAEITTGPGVTLLVAGAAALDP